MDLVFVPEAYSDEPPGLIPLTGLADKRDFQNPPGYLLVREVRSGGHYFRYLITNAFRTQLQRPISFPVEEGKAIYLGEIHLSYFNCQGNGPSVTIQTRDEWERDRQVLQKKLPNVRPEDVIKRVLPANWR
jgi:hypothetical protein